MTDQKRMYDRQGGFQYVTAEEAAKTPLEQEKTARVVMPEEDFRALQAKHAQPHGLCRHFHLRDGQQRAQNEQFFHRLFQEEKWSRRWIGNPQNFGVCDIFPDRLMDRHNPGVCRAAEAKGHPRYAGPTDWASSDQMVLCPYFESMHDKGRKIRSGRPS